MLHRKQRLQDQMTPMKIKIVSNLKACKNEIFIICNLVIKKIF